MLRNKLWIILLLLISIGANLKAEEIPEKVKLKIAESFSEYYGDSRYLDNFKKYRDVPFAITKSAKTHRKDLERYIYTNYEMYPVDPDSPLADSPVRNSVLMISDNLYQMPREYNSYVKNEEDGFTKQNAEEKIRNFIKLSVDVQDLVFEEIVWKNSYFKNSEGTDSNSLYTNVEVIITSKHLRYDYLWRFKYIEKAGILSFWWNAINQPEGEYRVGAGGFLGSVNNDRVDQTPIPLYDNSTNWTNRYT